MHIIMSLSEIVYPIVAHKQSLRIFIRERAIINRAWIVIKTCSLIRMYFRNNYLLLLSAYNFVGRIVMRNISYN